MADERVVVWLRGRTALVDGVAAGILLVAGVLIGVLVDADRAYFVFTLGLLAPLAFRRRWPEIVAGAVAGVAVAQWVMVRDTTGALPADVAVPVVVYTLAERGDRVWSRIGLAAGLIGAGLGGWSWPQLPMPVLAHVIVGGFLAGTVLAAWLGGAWQRARRGELVALAERAALLESTREQRTRLAVLSERTRIARDIHDILAHSLAVIVAQADGGRYAAPNDPEQAVAALRAIGDQGRRALTETRRAIGVLREDAGTDPDTAAGMGIPDIERLVADVRAAGAAVELNVALRAASLDPGVGLVAYRIVQEGLTNAVKHAGTGVRVEVSIRHVAEWLHVEVRDDGPAVDARFDARQGDSAARRGGYGLIGMRERVEVYGGELALRRRADRPGHLLAARIPMRQHTGRSPELESPGPDRNDPRLTPPIPNRNRGDR
ncbi:sensor histidine kinase [Nocardia inohanensis]|uniref:sensor histidine kinase n=1 Tax=Nocardia inohanensis TaxID=209246 RepID=UPI00083396DD|nr:histidine kinase [Nocardia inohanensis]